MNRYSRLSLVIATALATTVPLWCSAGIIILPHAIATNPTDACQSALPVFDGNVRKRPLAVQNEGAKNAFVTCSFSAIYPSLQRVRLYVHSTSGAPASLTCTGVSGWNTGQNVYIVKTLDLAGDGTRAMFTWEPADFPGAPSEFPGGGLFGVSCNLLPGMGVDNVDIDALEIYAEPEPI